MRILVFSDTHGHIDRCIQMINRIKDVDMVIHAGDTSSDAEDIAAIFSELDVRFVCGNCEVSRAPGEIEIDACGKKIFVTHGHYYNVKYEYDYCTLVRHARLKGAELAVFGHTHRPIYDNLGDISILNPGSARYGGTCGIIEIEDGKLRCALLDM